MEKDKQTDIERLKKRYKGLSNASLIASIICVALFVGGTAKMAHTSSLENDREDLKDRLYKYEANDEYRQMVDDDRRRLYEQLRCGDITLDEFNNEYLRIDSDNYFISWARTLEDENVRAIIDEYDRESAQLDEQMKIESAISGFSMAGGLSALTIREIFKRKREDLDEGTIETNDQIVK